MRSRSTTPGPSPTRSTSIARVFVLTRHDSAVTDFYDEAQVRRVYYPEMERLVAAMTGAGKVVVFDHTIRVADDRKRAARKARDPVKRVHNDFTERSAPQRVRDLLPPDEAEARLAGRYASINVWRPIVGPVETKPLVVCGYPSLDSRDLVAAERHYPDGRIGGIYMLAFNPSQRWFYFPAMATDEAVLLKCFDSLTDGTARWTAHGSFDPPAPPPRRGAAREHRGPHPAVLRPAARGRLSGGGLAGRAGRYGRCGGCRLAASASSTAPGS